MKESKKHIYNLILLDESGSMFADRSQVISNFNELIDDIRHQAKKNKNIKQYLSLITFNGTGIKVVLDCERAKQATHISDKDYNPNASTPLFDAMGYSIQSLKEKIKDQATVITTIFTDGMENSSVEFDSSTLKKIIGQLENKNWSFSYIGADHDVVAQARSLNISNTMMFSKTKAGFKRTLDVQRNYRSRINDMVDANINLTKDLKSQIWKETLENKELEDKQS